MTTAPVINIGSDVATTSSGLGAGAGPHLPVGTWQGTKYRSAMRCQPPSWNAWTAVTKATLKVKVSDHAHVGVRNSSIYVKRTTEANLWLGGSGTQNCNSGFSGSNNTQYSDLVPTSTDAKQFQSGSTANAVISIDVTAMVRYYWTNRVSSLTFIFDGEDSSDYTEFWSDDNYQATLTIEYTDAAPPKAPTLLLPAASAPNQSLTPTFSWTHDDTDGPQTGADVHLIEMDGPSDKGVVHVAGAANSLVWPTPLDPAVGVNYEWQVRTSNSTGTGPYSAYRMFSIPALPSIQIEPERQMVWDEVSKAPRLYVQCHPSFAFTEVRVQTDTGYDSNWGPGSMGFVLPVALTNGTPINVTVSIRDAGGTTATDTQAFTPRWGLTTQHRDLTVAPNAWQSAVVASTKPPGTDLKMEYGADPTSAVAPADGWHDDISDCPLARHLFWRAWFLPSNTASPVLDKVTILSSAGAVATLDKWGMNRSDPPAVPQTAMVPPWSVSTSEYVYGSRSAQCNVSGAGPFLLYSTPIVLRANRTYILTGLMKSTGNSGAQMLLLDDTGATLASTAMLTDPKGTLFYNDLHDVNRYKSLPYIVGGADKTVYVALRAGGVAGTRAYFDAVKVEESTVATAWSPGALGASIVDAGGVQIDASKGGVFRLRGSDDPNLNPRAVIELGAKGLLFAGDTELASPSVGLLNVNGQPIGGASVELLRYVPTGVIAVVPGTTYTATTAQLHTAPITAIPSEAVAVAVQLIANANVISPGDRYEIMDYNGVGYRAQGFSGKVASHYEALSSHYVVLGGDRQFDYKVTVGTAGNHLIIVNVLGYWLKEMSSAIAVGGGGDIIAHSDLTATVSITGTTEANANAVVTAPTVTLPVGAVVEIEFWVSRLDLPNIAGGNVQLWLYENGASVGRLATIVSATAGTNISAPHVKARRTIATAGDYAWSIRAMNGSSGTGQMVAGTGGAGGYLPGGINVRRVG